MLLRRFCHATVAFKPRDFNERPQFGKYSFESEVISIRFLASSALIKHAHVKACIEGQELNRISMWSLGWELYPRQLSFTELSICLNYFVYLEPYYTGKSCYQTDD